LYHFRDIWRWKYRKSWSWQLYT